MDICYLILAHRNPEQVQRLVNRLNFTNCFFYIHVDSATPIEAFEDCFTDRANVRFVEKRESGTWGGLGIVQATLNGLAQIVEDKKEGYCVLLSGQDYPLQSNEAIAAYLQKHRGASFADVWPLPDERWYNGGRDRIGYYKFDVPANERNYLLVPPLFSRDFWRHPRANGRKVRHLSRQGKWPWQLLRRRRFPGYLYPCGGSQWWAVTTEFAERIVGFENKKKYLRYHRHTLLPDEIFFQSLIRHFSVAENSSLQPSLTYVRFASKEDAHPVTFTAENRQELADVRNKNTGKLFARKFGANDAILDWLDNF